MISRNTVIMFAICLNFDNMNKHFNVNVHLSLFKAMGETMNNRNLSFNCMNNNKNKKSFFKPIAVVIRFFVNLPLCWTAAMREVCLRIDFSHQHISKYIKAASCWAWMHGGSVNGWTCKEQVMIVVEPASQRVLVLIACDSSISPVLSSHGNTLTECVMQV